jgi:hypothetical protein
MCPKQIGESGFHEAVGRTDALKELIYTPTSPGETQLRALRVVIKV